MKIKINDIEYLNIRRLTGDKKFDGKVTVTFIGDSLRGLESVDGVISVYADNGFLMQEVDPSKYLRTVINVNSIQLTNIPEGYVPSPTLEARVSNLEQTADALLGVSE